MGFISGFNTKEPTCITTQVNQYDEAKVHAKQIIFEQLFFCELCSKLVLSRTSNFFFM